MVLLTNHTNYANMYSAVRHPSWMRDMRTLQAERRIMPNRIRIEIFPKPHFRKYHVTTRVSAEKMHGGLLGGSRHEPFKQLSLLGEKTELGEDTKATIMRLYDIDGIDSVGLDTFQVELEIAPAYEWDEINDEIVDTIRQIAGWTDEEMTVDYLFTGRVYAEPVPREVYEREVDRQRAESARYDRMFDFGL